MTAPSLRRAVAVVAAALCGAVAALAVVPEGWSAPGGPGALPSLAPTAGAVSEPGAPSSPAGAGIPADDDRTAAPGSFGPQAVVPEPSPPTRVVVERLGIDMAVTPQGVDAQGQMALPEDPGAAGWYRFGPAPASPTGAVVVAAHVDSRERGLGPFARLPSARPGDQVLLDTGAARWRYDVTQVVRIGKDTGDLTGFFARDGAPRLHLVTCTGRYDQGSGYDANLVVVAERREKAV